MSSLSSFALELNNRLKGLHHITLISHRSPDGDALGSLEGMRGLLEANHPHLTVAVIVPPELTDTHIDWILGSTLPSLPESTDLIILLDTSLISRTKIPVEMYLDREVISIDHHESFPDAVEGYRDNTASSATIIITEMAEVLGWIIDPPTATALLLGIYTDTGGFIHRNTDARALATAARLLEGGADQSAIAQRTFGGYSLKYLHDLGGGLLSIEQVDRIAILCLPSDAESGFKSHIIGYLSGLENIDIACVLIPEEGIIRGSLRTRYDTIDVNQIAHRFGGGGHKKAAGFRTPGSIVDDIIHLEGKTYTLGEFAKLLVTNE